MEDLTGLGKLAEQLPVLTKEVRELILTVLKPVATEIGELMGDSVKQYRMKNFIKTLIKTEKILKKHGISPSSIKPKYMLPIVEGISLEDDEMIQYLWANLLATSIKEQETDPHHITILKSHLTKNDALVLIAINQIIIKQQEKSHNKILRKELIIPLKKINDKSKITEANFILSINKLLSLGLCRHTELGQVVVHTGAVGVTTKPTKENNDIYLTPLGRHFVDVCTGEIL